jgi:hypothetical protein
MTPVTIGGSRVGNMDTQQRLGHGWHLLPVLLWLVRASVAHAQLAQRVHLSPEDAARITAAESLWECKTPEAIVQAKRAGTPHVVPGIAVFSAATPRIVFTISNPLDSVAQVDLAVRLSYPHVDTAGTLVPDSLSTVQDAAHDMSGWVHAPAHLTIAPHAMQAVVMTVTPPEPVRTGEYWTTLVITTRRAVLSYRQFLGDSVVQLSGGMMTIQAKPVIADLIATVPIVYRRGTVATGLVLPRPPRTTLVGDSVARVCASVHRTGAAHADALVRVTLVSATRRDTAGATVPLGVYTDMTPCLPINVRSLPPGTYTATVNVTGDRDDLPSAARLPFASLQATIILVLPVAIRRAADAARASDTAEDVSDSVFSQVTIDLKNGPLLTQLAAEAAKAAWLGRTPILDIGAAWCGPCHVFNHLMRLRGLRETMRGMYVIHADADVWGEALSAAGVGTPSLPVVVALARDGHPTQVQIGGVAAPPDSIMQQLRTNLDQVKIDAARPDLEQFFQGARAEFAKWPQS